MPAEVIVMKPTWREILQTMLVIQRDATEEGRRTVLPEFERMAALADHANACRVLLDKLIKDTDKLGFKHEDADVNGGDAVDWLGAFRAEVEKLLSTPLV